jgi:carboxypeptidase PM20D1
MLRRIAWAVAALLALLVLLVVVLVANTWRQDSRQIEVPALAPLAVDERAAAESLAAAIRARTVSGYDDPDLNADQFRALHAHLQARYPRVHAALQREVVGGLSLLYTWRGTDPGLPAIVLMAHQDVVPIAPNTESKWQAQPFAGEIKDGFVWGRGAWDDKSNLIAQLEAVEMLLGTGFQPQRTLHLVFGADEEVGGERGAAQIARRLQERGTKVEFVVDEGLLIVEGIIPGLNKPTALIGVAEKGYVSVDLRAEAAPGHSSIPPALPGQSAIGRLAGGLARLDRNPLPVAVGGVADQMFDTLAPEFDGLNRYVLTNRWLLGPVVNAQLTRSPSTNATLRTTTAMTVIAGGDKDNVLPGVATATVNFRLLPGDTPATVVEHVRRTIADDRIEITTPRGGREASQVSSTTDIGYRTIERSVRELFPGTVVAPGLMVGGTDAKHFEGLARNVYRFSPVRASAEDLARFHGTNERISVANLADLIRFYHRLIHQSAGPSAGPERKQP